jgi:hypothetical protein
VLRRHLPPPTTSTHPPPPQALNREPLFRVRGDIFANETKSVKEPISVMAELHLLVSREQAPEVSLPLSGGRARRDRLAGDRTAAGGPPRGPAGLFPLGG